MLGDLVQVRGRRDLFDVSEQCSQDEQVRMTCVSRALSLALSLSLTHSLTYSLTLLLHLSLILSLTRSLHYAASTSVSGLKLLVYAALIESFLLPLTQS